MCEGRRSKRGGLPIFSALAHARALHASFSRTHASPTAFKYGMAGGRSAVRAISSSRGGDGRRRAPRGAVTAARGVRTPELRQGDHRSTEFTQVHAETRKGGDSEGRHLQRCAAAAAGADPRVFSVGISASLLLHRGGEGHGERKFNQ